MITSPTSLKRIFRVVESVGHHVKETGCISLHAPFIVRILLTQSTFALNMLLVQLPISLAKFALFLPSTLVPNKLQIVLEFLAQPHMRAVGPIHTHAIVHILIGDGIDAELMDELLQFLWRMSLLNTPDGLRQGVCPTPCSYIDRSGVVFISKPDQQVATLRIVALAYHLDTSMHATHHRTTLQIVSTGPIAKWLLSVLFLKSHK